MVSGAGSERMALTEERMAARYLVDRAWRSPEATGFNLECDLLGYMYLCKTASSIGAFAKHMLTYGSLAKVKIRLRDMFKAP